MNWPTTRTWLKMVAFMGAGISGYAVSEISQLMIRFIGMTLNVAEEEFTVKALWVFQIFSAELIIMLGLAVTGFIWTTRAFIKMQKEDWKNGNKNPHQNTKRVSP